MQSILLELIVVALLLMEKGATSRVAHFTDIEKHELEPSNFEGVMDLSKLPSQLTGVQISLSVAEIDIELDILASKLSWLHVDANTGQQIEVILDVGNLQNVLEQEQGVGAKQSRSERVGEQSCEGSACEGDRHTRRLYIFPPDERTEVTEADWSPPMHVGLLTFSGGYCTGTLVGPRHVLTAAHCLHEGEGGDWHSNVRFQPGHTSTDATTDFSARRLFAFNGWIEDSDRDYDMGLVELAVDTGIGWVSMGFSSDLSEDWYMYSKGYPGDKEYGSQWSTSGYPSDVNTLSIEFDTLDAVGGQSGSPIYYYQESEPVIYGTYFGEAWFDYVLWRDEWNQFTRITGGRFSVLCDWIDDERVGC